MSQYGKFDNQGVKLYNIKVTIHELVKKIIIKVTLLTSQALKFLEKRG